VKSVAILLLFVGCLLIVSGLLLFWADKFPWLGNLPGDLHLKFKNVRVHIPLTSCILASIFLTILLNILLRFFRK